LLGALWAAILTPLLFYLKFGSINWFSIAFTIFLVVLSLLFALGFFFQTRKEYHTEVPMERSLADRIGAFWLVACAFGPFLGWMVTAIPPTEASWKWQYLSRAFLAVILPVITAVPLVPYGRGKAALIAIPLLVVITALPILSCVWVLGDLYEGPARVAVYDESNDEVVWAISGNGTNGTIDDNIAKQIPSRFRGEVMWLRHTGKILSMKDNHTFMRSRRTTRTPERQSSLISKR
jgi:hypothetical protein